GEEPLRPVLLVGDGPSLHAQHSLDERPQRRHRTASLAAGDACQRITLLLGGPLVNDDAYRPVALSHSPWGMRDHREVQIIEGRPSVSSLIDVKGQRNEALTLRGRGRHIAGDAGTEVGATARLEVVTCDLPRDLRHGGYLREQRTRLGRSVSVFHGTGT